MAGGDDMGLHRASPKPPSQDPQRLSRRANQLGRRKNRPWSSSGYLDHNADIQLFGHPIGNLVVAWDEVRAEQIRRWASGDAVSLESLIASHPELAADSDGVFQLICGEIGFRSARGERPDPAEYARRFPQCALLLGVSSPVDPAPVARTAPERNTPPAPPPGDSEGTMVWNSGPSAPPASPALSPPSATNSAESAANFETANFAPTSVSPGPASRASAPSMEQTAVISPPSDSPSTKAPSAAGSEATIGLGSAPAPPKADWRAQLDHLPDQAGTVAVALPRGAMGGAPSYDTIQSADDAQSFSTIIERSTVPSLKIPGYEILGELGCGGMGVVYRARQISADRIVALKVVRDDVLETLPSATRANALERFRYEAQAAAKLEHDHLVSVYEVGESNGLRFYAMRFVDGKSLAELLRDGPLANRRAAEYLEPVCRAIQAIHEQGVLHRDLKPHNIMIDRKSDRPLVTDFGLAKFIGTKDELTHAGSVIGTPSYMSPEQAKDSGKVGPLADVYSLGATLYHVVAGRAPFQAAFVADTLRQILHDDPIPPRKLNPALDRDLETICLKTLAKDPAQRYGSAGALADDLKRYLNGEPIVARPISMFGRAWRWCRRNRMVATLGVVAAALALFGATAVAVGYYQTSLALAASNASLLRSLDVVDQFCTTVAEEDLKNLPGFQPLRRDLLQRAQRYYESFLADHSNDPRLRDELGQAYFRLGVILEESGAANEAYEKYQTAAELQRRQVAAKPNEPTRRRSLGNTINALGQWQTRDGNFDAARAAFDEAIEIRRKLAEDFPDAVEFHRTYANALMNRGLVERSEAEVREDSQLFETARRYIDESQRYRRAMLDGAGELRRSIERDLARGYLALGVLADLERAALEAGNASNEQRDQAAERVDRACEQAAELFQRLIDKTPEIADRYAWCRVQLLRWNSRLGRDSGERVRAGLAEILARMEQLALENREVPLYLAEIVNVRMGMAQSYVADKDEESAKRETLAALQQAQELAKRFPSFPGASELVANIEEDLRNSQ